MSLRVFPHATHGAEIGKTSVTLACINSAVNVTLSGPEEDIDRVKEVLDKGNVSAQKLQTGGMAYHSPYMEAVASGYLALLGTLDHGDADHGAGQSKSPYLSGLSIPIVSSLTGHQIINTDVLTTAQYWVDNLVSPVKFSDAMRTLIGKRLAVSAKPLTDLIEIGPHPALRRPIQENLGDISGGLTGTGDSCSKRVNVQRYH